MSRDVDGGIWKTTDGGIHWDAIFDGQDVSSVGALAVAWLDSLRYTCLSSSAEKESLQCQPVPFSPVRSLQRLALFAALAQPALLRAQVPRVTSARLTFHVAPQGVGVDTGYMLLIIRIGGLPGQRLRALRRTDVVITDSEKRAYAPEGWAIGARDRLGSDENVDYQWLFRVPYAHTAFALWLPTFAPVPFIATYSMAPTPVRR